MAIKSLREAPTLSFANIHAHCAPLSNEVRRAFDAIAGDKILNSLSALPYPYDTLVVIDQFKKLLQTHLDFMLSELPNNWVLDIGGAHGEVTFLFERAGFKSTYVDVIKEGHTFPHIASALAEEIGSFASIIVMDIDEEFDTDRVLSGIRARYGAQEKFGLSFFSGVFYHLKNPYRVLERIKASCNYCMMTTRVFSNAPEDGMPLSHLSAAYFLKDRELNHDPTNYFVFTHTGLRNLIERAGFEILAMERTFSRQDKASNPSSMDQMETAYLVLKSKE